MPPSTREGTRRRRPSSQRAWRRPGGRTHLAAAAALTALAYYGGVAGRSGAHVPAVDHVGAVAAERLADRGVAARAGSPLVGVSGGGAPGAPRARARRRLSAALVVLLFLTNCAEALIAAGGPAVAERRADRVQHLPARRGVHRRRRTRSRRWCRRSPMPPWCHFVRGEPYWAVWRSGRSRNALTELSVVPCAVLGIQALRRGIRMPRRSRTRRGGGC